jgi:TolB-like protein
MTVADLRSENLTVLYFDNNTGKPEYQWMSKGLADMLMGDLSLIPEISLVERENLNKILKEQALSSSGLTEGQSIQVGRLLEANKIIMGFFVLSGGKIRIDIRITDTESGIIVHSSKVEGPYDGILNLEKILAGKVMEGLGKSRPPGFETRESGSVDATAVYYQGLDLLDSGKAGEALIKFQEASGKDPTYSKPVHGIEDSYRFLKDFKKQRQQREIALLYEKMNAFKRKLGAKTWVTYSEWVTRNNNADPDVNRRFQDSPDGQALMLCDVPARCVWHLMMTRIEAGDKLEEYFGETKKKEALYRENLKDALRAKQAFPDDPVLAEVLYMEIFSLHFLGEKKAVRTKSEEFLGKYPDYRLVEFVEEWYEESLKEE